MYLVLFVLERRYRGAKVGGEEDSGALCAAVTANKIVVSKDVNIVFRNDKGSYVEMIVFVVGLNMRREKRKKGKA